MICTPTFKCFFFSPFGRVLLSATKDQHELHLFSCMQVFFTNNKKICLFVKRTCLWNWVHFFIIYSIWLNSGKIFFDLFIAIYVIYQCSAHIKVSSKPLNFLIFTSDMIGRYLIISGSSFAWSMYEIMRFSLDVDWHEWYSSAVRPHIIVFEWHE